MTESQKPKFCFVTSKPNPPIKVDAAKGAIQKMGLEEKILVFGVPASSGVDEQPFGTVTEHGAVSYGGSTENNAIGRVADLEQIFLALPVYLKDGTLPVDDPDFAERVKKTKDMLEDQIKGYQAAGDLPAETPVNQLFEELLDMENRHSVFSFENGMYTLEEAEERREKCGGGINFANLDKAKEIGGEFIDTCVCAVVMPGQDPVISYDAGLPIHPDLNKYIYQVMGYNQAIVENGISLKQGLTATRRMMDAGALQKFCDDRGWQEYRAQNGLDDFNHQDPHTPGSFALQLYGPGTHKTRAEFLAEGVEPAFQGALTLSLSPDQPVAGKGFLVFGGQEKGRAAG